VEARDWARLPEFFHGEILRGYVVLREGYSGEWKECRLGDVCEKVLTGGTPLTKHSEYYENGKIPWLKTKEVNFCKIDETEYYITEAGLKNSSAKIVPKHSVIIAMYGQGDTAGRVAINTIPLATNQACCNLVIDSTLSDYRFIYFYLKNSYLDLVSRKTGSAQPNLNTRLIKDFEISLPPLPEQKAIASTLSSLDDKIDLLHRQNKTLEAMAETLFRQWFIEGARDDWEDGCLMDVADINPRYTLKKGTLSTYVEMKNLSTTTFNPEGWYKREITSGMKFKNGDTLLARITPCLENGKTAFIAILDEDEIGWGSTEYIVIRMKEGYHPFISYLIAKDREFRAFAIGSMSGSSGRQRAQANVLKEFDFKIPPQKVISNLNEQLSSIVEKLKVNAAQIKTLENLRNTLLPKLMTGEVRVRHD
jgi:type I restriction enzyme S subunit